MTNEPAQTQGDVGKPPALPIVASILAFGLALFAVFFALGVQAIGCHQEAYSECSAAAEMQLWVAVAGLVPAFLAVATSIRGRGRPGMWFVITCVVYASWIVALVASQS